MTEPQELVLRLFGEDATVSIRNIAERMGLRCRTIETHIAALKKRVTSCSKVMYAPCTQAVHKLGEGLAPEPQVAEVPHPVHGQVHEQVGLEVLLMVHETIDCCAESYAQIEIPHQNQIIVSSYLTESCELIISSKGLERGVCLA